MTRFNRRVVLWWGRFDPDYSRNRVLRRLFAELDWTVVDFHPVWSPLADIEAGLRRLARPSLVWVPCFRQRDIAAAHRWSRRHGVPLIVDPLISAYDKQVFERHKFAEGSRRAEGLRAWESGLLKHADRVVIDTPAHGDFLVEAFGIARDRIDVVHVGAEEGAFIAAPPPTRVPGEPREAMFFGSFIGLQGPQVIVQAARRYQGPPIRWVLLGEGPLRPGCERQTRDLDNVVFANTRISANPGRIHEADILLGVFGASAKAGRVIPNKVFQALASGRPVVTRGGTAYPEALRTGRGESGLVFVPPEDPAALAAAVGDLAADPARLAQLSKAARATYDSYFASAAIREQLRAVLDATLAGRR